MPFHLDINSHFANGEALADDQREEMEAICAIISELEDAAGCHCEWTLNAEFTSSVDLIASLVRITVTHEDLCPAATVIEYDLR